MDFSKLTTSDKVMAGSGLALFIFSFLKWFDYHGYGGRNAWDYFLFGVIPVLLGLLLVGYVALTRFGNGFTMPNLPVPEGLALLIVAGLAAVLILLKLIIGDSVGGLGITIHLNRAYGLFLSLLAALGLVGGAFMKFQESGGQTSKSEPGAGPTTPF